MPASSPAGTTGRYDACNLFLLPPIFFLPLDQLLLISRRWCLRESRRKYCQSRGDRATRQRRFPIGPRLRKFVRSIGRRRLRRIISDTNRSSNDLRTTILRSVEPNEPRLNSRTDLCLVLPCTELQRVRGKIITLDRTRR